MSRFESSFINANLENLKKEVQRPLEIFDYRIGKLEAIGEVQQLIDGLLSIDKK
jgi:hypothetical protein